MTPSEQLRAIRATRTEEARGALGWTEGTRIEYLEQCDVQVATLLKEVERLEARVGELEGLITDLLNGPPGPMVSDHEQVCWQEVIYEQLAKAMARALSPSEGKKP